jgi:putative oxidoreductase
MKESCSDTRCPISASLGLLVLRVVVGVSLAMHGYSKLHEPVKSQFFDLVKSMGAPFASAPQAFAWAAIAAELGGGILLALGLLSRVAAFFIMCTMLTAVFKMHWGQGYPAMEPAAVYAAVAVAFLLGNPGRISVDGMLFGKKAEPEPPEDH